MTTNRRLVADTVEGNAYATPFWASQLLLDVEKFHGPVWECCAGSGHISKVLLDNGYITYSSDLYNWPVIPELPIDHIVHRNVDALKVQDQIENVISNPPYSEAEDFIRMCNRVVLNKFAFLLRLAFLEGADRCTGLFKEIPPNRVYVFADRVSMYPIGDERISGGTTAYGWFVWNKQEEYRQTEVKWLHYDDSKQNRYERIKRKRGRKAKENV